VCHRPSVSLNNEKICREIREHKIAVCEKTQCLRSGNFSDLNSACSKVLVPVKIFQFHHMHYESERFREAANGLKVRYFRTGNRELFRHILNEAHQAVMQSCIENKVACHQFPSRSLRNSVLFSG
jgi:hypothetical protein